MVNFKVGNRVKGKTIAFKNSEGTITKIISNGNKKKYEIRWVNGNLSEVHKNAFELVNAIPVLDHMPLAHAVAPAHDEDHDPTEEEIANARDEDEELNFGAEE